MNMNFVWFALILVGGCALWTVAQFLREHHLGKARLGFERAFGTHWFRDQLPMQQALLSLIRNSPKMTTLTQRMCQSDRSIPAGSILSEHWRVNDVLEFLGIQQSLWVPDKKDLVVLQVDFESVHGTGVLEWKTCVQTREDGMTHLLKAMEAYSETDFFHRCIVLSGR